MLKQQSKMLNPPILNDKVCIALTRLRVQVCCLLVRISFAGLAGSDLELEIFGSRDITLESLFLLE